ncbi:MAG: protein kinase [Deltaproteobacteria bacterium]|nr:protein kinase [Deltaproteobacteria bacterium]
MATRAHDPGLEGLPTQSIRPEGPGVEATNDAPLPRIDTEPSGDPEPGPNPTARRTSATADEDPENEKTQIGKPSAPPPATRPSRPSPSTVGQRIRDRHRRDPRIGRTLAGRYRLERLIAKGGMGRVYLATQLPLDRAVAVKVLKHEFQESDPNFVRRFFLEASTSARLTHPNVITVHDYGEDEGSGELFMAMEYVEGVPLSYAIGNGGPFVAERVLNIGIQIGRALREAHEKGIIHRDLKPGNVMLLDKGDEPDAIKVLDFGLAKLVERKEGESPFGSPDGPDGESDLTKSGTLLGSPRYMSPEQIRGEPLDGRTDIYSLGVMLYQMAAGRPPFLGETSVDIIYKHLHEKAAPIGQVSYAADCPPELEIIIEKCLEKSRDHRFQSMSEVIAALKTARQALIGGPVGEGALPYDSGGGARERLVSRLSPPLALAPTVELEPTPPAAPEAAFREPVAERSGPLSTRASERHRTSRRWLWAGVVATAAASVTLAVALTEEAPPPEARTTVAQPVPPVAPPATPKPPERIQVRFESIPEGATVVESGRTVGTTPFMIDEPLDGRARSFVFQLPAHEDTQVDTVLDPERPVIHATLPPSREPDPEPSRGAGPSEPPERPVKAKRPPKKARPKRDEKPAEVVDDDADPETRERYRQNPY